MSATAITIAGAYYDLFRHAGSMTEVPMRDDLTFTSPRFRLASAEAFRAALNDLLPRVANFRMQSQFHDDATVVTFYELDLGAPGGPIAMAERLRVDEGRLTAVDLIFDSARLPAPPER